MTLFLFAILFLLVNHVFGTDYWISASTGSDANSGRSISLPFQSIKRIYNEQLVSGDFVHLCKGDRWTYSMISNTVSGVTWDSYTCRPGFNSKPQITPSIDLNYQQWRISTSNPTVLIFDISTDLIGLGNGFIALWANNIRYSLARWPNLLNPVDQITWGQVGEFAQMIGINGTVLHSNELTQPNGYFTGTRMHVRLANWLYADSYVTNSTAGSLTLSSHWGIQPNLYFFLEANMNGKYPNHIQLLDMVGEFVFDVASKAIYMIPLTDDTRLGILNGTVLVSALYPNAGTAASMVQSGTLTGLELTMGTGGFYGKASNILVQNCSIKHVLGQGFTIQGWMDNIRFVYNEVDDVESDCVAVNSLTGVVSYNNISRCGLWGRTSISWNGVTIGSGLCSFNRISNCGYSCVHPHYGSTIDSNIINNSMMTLNDGGAIYAYGTTDYSLNIKNNVITNVYGNYASYFPTRIASCITMDDNSYGSILQGNTCSGSVQECIVLHRSSNHMVLMNNYQSPGIYLVEGSGHQVAGNLVRTNGTDGVLQNPLFRITSTRTNYNNLVNVWSQLYCSTAPPSNYIFQRQTSDGTWRYNNLNDWVNAERVFNSNFEMSSQLWSNCAGLKPIDLNSPNPWGFAMSSSSSTGTKLFPTSSSVSSSIRSLTSSSSSPSLLSSLISSSSSSSSSLLSSSSSRSSSSSPSISSSSSSSGLTPLSSSSVTSSSSIDSFPWGYPLAGCMFRGPYNLVAASLNFTTTIRDLDKGTGDRFMQDLADWGVQNGFNNLWTPTANPLAGLYCAPLIQQGTTYIWTVWLIKNPRAVEYVSLLANMIRSNNYTGPTSGVTVVMTSNSVPMQQCPKGVLVHIPNSCPGSSASSTGVKLAANAVSAGGIVVVIIVSILVSFLFVSGILYRRCGRFSSDSIVSRDVEMISVDQI